MKTVEMMRNQTFREMEKAALKRLDGFDALEISKRTKIPFDGDRSVFTVTSLGMEIEITFPDFEITPHLPDWHHLMILHYLEMSDGTPLTGKQISFRELPDGFIRGEQFDRACERSIQNSIGEYDPNKLAVICENLGAEIMNGKADLCAEFSFLPLYPLTLNIWFAEEDLPGSGKILLDSSAGHHLSTEDAVTVGDLLLEMIQKEYQKRADH